MDYRENFIFYKHFDAKDFFATLSTMSNAMIILSVFLFLIGIVGGYGIWRFVRAISQSIAGYGIPYVMTPNKKIHTLLDHLKLNKGDTFIDIGCGDGRILEAVKSKNSLLI